MLASCGINRKPCGKTRIAAADFARLITRDLTAKEAARRLDCSARVVEGLRSGSYPPGAELITHWRTKFHPFFDQALNGEDPEIAVRKARIAALIGEIRELRGK